MDCGERIRREEELRQDSGKIRVEVRGSGRGMRGKKNGTNNVTEEQMA